MIVIQIQIGWSRVEILPQKKKSCHQKKKSIKLHGGQLDITTNIYLKSCAYHADSAALVQNAAPSFMGI